MVTLDLVLGAKVKPILFLIDWHSRLTVGREIPNKRSESVAKVILKCWVGVGYGAPGCLYSDQGGEFSGKGIHDADRLFGKAASTTSGYSPFSNGLNEKNQNYRSILTFLRCLSSVKKGCFQNKKSSIFAFVENLTYL